MMDRRVLLIAPDTYGRIGGLQQFNRRLIDNLDALLAAEGRLDVLVMRDPTDALPRLAAGEVRGIGSAARMMGEVLVRARAADTLVIAHINLLPAAVAARMVNPRIKTLLVVHGIEAWNDPAYRRRRFHEPAMLRLVDRVVAVSNFTAAVMAREFSVDPARFALLPNAVDPLPHPPLAERGPVVLTVGRLALLDRGKNIDAVIRAMAEVVRARPDARLEIVGDGELRPELEGRAAALGLADHVRFLGRVDDAELARAYARASVFVLPSSKEGFGIVFLEAWQHGLPVICGTDDAAQEIVSHGADGFAVHPRDISKLARTIESLLNDPALAARMGAEGARKVRDRYLDQHFRLNLSDVLAGLRGEAPAGGSAPAEEATP